MLAVCTEPIAANITAIKDYRLLTGWYISKGCDAATVARGGCGNSILPRPKIATAPFYFHIEQCGDRIVISGNTSDGDNFVHDFLHADGTLESGASDFDPALFPLCQPYTASGTFEYAARPGDEWDNDRAFQFVAHQKTTINISDVVGAIKHDLGGHLICPGGTQSVHAFLSPVAACALESWRTFRLKPVLLVSSAGTKQVVRYDFEYSVKGGHEVDEYAEGKFRVTYSSYNPVRSPMTRFDTVSIVTCVC